MSTEPSQVKANNKKNRALVIDKQLVVLNPVDRISEVIYGLIMALTFTCTISISQTGRTEVRDMLIGALGCNIAWGLVDGVMFILTGLTEKGHGRKILRMIRKTTDDENARRSISDELPPLISSIIKEDELENMRKILLTIPESDLHLRVGWTDIKKAMGIFLIVFLSTVPVAIPFTFINDVHRALRVSNFTAIVLMFIAGWMLAKYGGYNKLIMGFALTLLGIVLVVLTIALGG